MKSFKDLREKTLTPAEKKKREEIAKAMERENPGMNMKKKMAISTSQAKKIAEAKDPNEYDKEGAMMKNQLRQICSANEKLMKMVGDDDNLPEWVQNKVTKATDYIRTVRDYLEAENIEDDEDKEDEDDEELDEAVKIGSKVRIHAPGKDYHGKVGHVGEIRRGPFAKAPPSYTIDYREPGEDRNRSVMLPKEKIKLHKESVELDKVYQETANYLVSEGIELESLNEEQLDELIGAVARGIGRGLKRTVVNKKGNFRFSTAGRADAAQKTADATKKKIR